MWNLVSSSFFFSASQTIQFMSLSQNKTVKKLMIDEREDKLGFFFLLLLF